MMAAVAVPTRAERRLENTVGSVSLDFVDPSSSSGLPGQSASATPLPLRHKRFPVAPHPTAFSNDLKAGSQNGGL